MISLSSLIKSSHVLTLDEMKKLQLNSQHQFQGHNLEEQVDCEPEIERPDAATISLRDQIIADAKATAEARIQEAAQECDKLMQDAQDQIDVWWLEKRNEDESIIATHQKEGFEKGYQAGLEQAQLEVQKQWQQQLDESAHILQDAHRIREQIIQEAEPFIVELSSSIAEKIIGKQLSLEPQMILDIITRTLSRRREQGEITLCVSPENLSFVQAAREELNATIDSQAELVIIPDSTVKDAGCVIRSKFGSIDARIDTQLSEIKRELLLIAHQSVEERGQQHETD